MNTAVRIFEDLHTLAHRWTQYCADHHHVTFREFLEKNEPLRSERLYRIYEFVCSQVDEEVKRD